MEEKITQYELDVALVDYIILVKGLAYDGLLDVESQGRRFDFYSENSQLGTFRLFYRSYRGDSGPGFRFHRADFMPGFRQIEGLPDRNLFRSMDEAHERLLVAIDVLALVRAPAPEPPMDERDEY